MKRREFLRKASIAGGLPLVGGGIPILNREAYGQVLATKERYFIQIHIEGGGLDQVSTFDARDPSVFTEARVSETRINFGFENYPYPFSVDQYDLPNHTLGTPTSWLGSIMGETRNHLDRLAIIRGGTNETVSHSGGVGRSLFGFPEFIFRSGNLISEFGSSFGVLFGSIFGGNEPIPTMYAGAQGLNFAEPAYANPIRVDSSYAAFKMLEAQERAGTEEQRSLINDFLEAEHDERDTEFLRRASNSFKTTQYLLESNLAANFATSAMALEVKSIFNNIPSASGAAVSLPHWELATLAIATGVSRSFTGLSRSGPWDCHATLNGANNIAQAELTAMARCLEYLDTVDHPSGGTYGDKTYIIITGDFYRTPYINSSMGRDHWPGAGFIMLGPDFIPGVYGASTDIGQSPTYMNLLDGSPSDELNGTLVTPANVFRTILHMTGVETDFFRYRVDPILAMVGA